MNATDWNLDPSRFPANQPIGDQLAFVCQYGALAPSVHNMQPWRLTISGNELTVAVDPRRTLTHGDPTGRQTWLSLGAFLENTIVAGSHFGLVTTSRPKVDESSRSVSLSWKSSAPKTDDRLAAIRNRRSNRHRFSSEPLSDKALQEFSGINIAETTITMLTSRQHIATIAQLTGQAISLAFSNPAFRNELAEVLRPNLSRKKHGLFGYSLAINPLRAHGLESYLVRRGVNRRGQARKEQAMIESAAAIALVFAKGDVPKYWLAAGQAYEQVCLTAAKLGVSQSTTAGVVEAADFHRDVAKLVNTNQRLQAVVRLGYSKKRPKPSPRYHPTELTASP